MPLETDKLGGFKFSIEGQELQTSVYPGQHPRVIPLWEEGENVQFTDLGVKKVEGYVEIGDTTNAEPMRGILQRAEGGALIAYAGDLSTLYRVDGDGAFIETKGTGYNLTEDAGAAVWDGGATIWDGGASVWDEGITPASHWSMADYGSFIFATSGIDSPQIKTTDGNFANLYQGVVYAAVTTAGTGYVVDDILTLTGGTGTGATLRVLSVDGGGGIVNIGIESSGTGYTTAPTGFTGGTGTGAAFTYAITDLDVSTALVVLVRGPHVLLFNTSLNSKEFIFCDADDPYTWQTAPNNLAGALTIRELKSPIRAAVPLGSSIAVYGDDQMFLVNYLGNELVFGYQPAINGIGAVSPKAVTPVGSRNFGLARQGFFMTDGSNFQYIDLPIRYWFRENVAASQISKAVAWHDEKNTNVRWYFPTSDIRVNVGVSYNYEKNIWTLLTDDKSCGEERVLQSFPITGDSSGKVYKQNLSENANGSAITAFIRSKPLDMQNVDRVKEISSIRLGYTGDGLTWRIGWSETESGTINWKGYRTPNAGYEFNNVRTAGRWLHVEVYSNTLNADWELLSIEIIGRIEGTR